jgi:hypothetical protein
MPPELFHKLECERILPNSFYEASINLITKPNKDVMKRKNYIPISLINIHVNILKKSLQTEFDNTLKRPYNHN